MLSALRFRAVASASVAQRMLSTTTPHVKHVVPQKRASRVLAMLKEEEYVVLKGLRQFPTVRAGDAIEVDKLPYISADAPETIKGLVLGVTKKGADTAIKMVNVEYGVPLYRRLVMYSPMITDIRVTQPAFIHKGNKRVRRSKIYYMTKRHPDNFVVA